MNDTTAYFINGDVLDLLHLSNGSLIRQYKLPAVFGAMWGTLSEGDGKAILTYSIRYETFYRTSSVGFSPNREPPVPLWNIELPTQLRGVEPGP
jgi:hypothetical protein